MRISTDRGEHGFSTATGDWIHVRIGITRPAILRIFAEGGLSGRRSSADQLHEFLAKVLTEEAIDQTVDGLLGDHQGVGDFDGVVELNTHRRTKVVSKVNDMEDARRQIKRHEYRHDHQHQHGDLSLIRFGISAGL